MPEILSLTTINIQKFKTVISPTAVTASVYVHKSHVVITSMTIKIVLTCHQYCNRIHSSICASNISQILF